MRALRFIFLALAAVALAPAACRSADAHDPVLLSHGRFLNFPVYTPVGTPQSFVLLLSRTGGPDAASRALVPLLMSEGAMVAVLDLAQLRTSLEADTADCVFPDGDLENLSHFTQAYFHLPAYFYPVLIGDAAAAPLVYASLAQAPSNTFAAALTLGFCPVLDLRKPLCKAGNLQYSVRGKGHGVNLSPAASLANPWVTLQGEIEAACSIGVARQFVSQVKGAALVALPRALRGYAAHAQELPPFRAAFNSLAAHNPTVAVAAPPAAMGDLPVIELAAQAATDTADFFAIMLSGDGGWAGLDRDVATALTVKGIPVVGLDSLRYFWTARTAQGLATDIDRMIRFYGAQFDKKRVLLIGYSQGADVLPFAVNRLPAETRRRVALTAVLGMSAHALFEFHVSSWLAEDDSGPLTLPEVGKLTGMPVLCIYGADEDDSLCPQLDSRTATVVKLKGGHHFDGDYAGLARQILSAVKP